MVPASEPGAEPWRVAAAPRERKSGSQLVEGRGFELSLPCKRDAAPPPPDPLPRPTGIHCDDHFL
jgi:hypothetical protein